MIDPYVIVSELLHAALSVFVIVCSIPFLILGAIACLIFSTLLAGWLMADWYWNSDEYDDDDDLDGGAAA